MRKLVSFLLSIFMGLSVMAQSEGIVGNYFFEGFQDSAYAESTWIHDVDWSNIDLGPENDNNRMMYTYTSAASQSIAKTIISPVFMLSSSDCAAESTGSISFWTSVLEDEGFYNMEADFILAVIVNNEDPFIVDRRTAEANEGFQNWVFPLSQLGALITSSTPVSVRFAITQASINGGGFFLFDEFKFKRFGNANCIDLYTYDAEFIGYESNEEEDSAYVAPDYTYEVPEGYAFAYWDIYHLDNGLVRMGVRAFAGERITGIDENLVFFATLGKRDTIIFDANGGDGLMESQVVTQFTTDTLNANTYTKDGFAFIGWNTSPSGDGVEYSNGGLFSTDGDTNITLYAQWIVAHEMYIAFNSNGGNGIIDTAVMMQYSEYSAPVCSYTRYGYTFTHWNTSADGSGTSYNEGDVVTTLESITLYAQWRVNTIKVAFDANGGVGTMDTATVPQYSGYHAPACAFTLDHHDFDGWNTAADGSGTTYAADAQISTVDDITLYAQWKHSTVRISFGANNGTGTTVDTMVLLDSVYLAPACSFARRGYSFSRWNTAFNGAGTDYAVGDTLPTGSNLNLYAQWDRNSIAIVYDANGGVGSMDTDRVYQYNVYLVEECLYTLDGYTFVGWNTATDGSGEEYEDGDELPTDSDIILYAQWSLNTITLTFVANGGNGNMDEEIVFQDSVYLAPACTFVRGGFTFVGWNTKADGSGDTYEVGDTLPTSNSYALYAMWESDGTTSISTASALNVRVYPNPTVGKVIVSGAKVQGIDVIDMNGRTIRANEGSNTIDLSGLNKGVYTLCIHANEGMKMVRIVKE